MEDKTPTPKNQARRNARMARRITQRRAQRKARMLNYLVLNGLLPAQLTDCDQPEIILNELGDPYHLRAKALDEALSAHELGRVLLHLVQRRGFQSNRKTLLGDMVDDPDALAVLTDSGLEHSNEELTEFKQDIDDLRNAINNGSYRTLGEYLNTIPKTETKRNRRRDGGKRKTDRQMYKEEFWLIVGEQSQFHPVLDNIKENLFEIIFFQRPLRLKKDRVGKCSLEPNSTRSKKAWSDYQRFRYLQDINNLRYFDENTGAWIAINEGDREKLVVLFETEPKITITKIKKCLGLSARGHRLNFESGSKRFKGNLTAMVIREVFSGWDSLNTTEQLQLETDLITYEKKSALKKRLIEHWKLPSETAVNLCVTEFESEHADLSLKAIRRLLPHLEKGMVYSDARQAAGYGYDTVEREPNDKLGKPPEIPNPIVSKGMHEIKRVVNAIIKQYGKPTVIRVEMARDLEMNTKRYAAFLQQQKKNEKLNQEAQEHFESVVKAKGERGKSKYASRDDKLKYRLWKEQQHLCAYSLKTISQTQLYSSDVEIDHIIPYSVSMNDSYVNKVVCISAKNQQKANRTPIDAFGETAQWEEIETAVGAWYKNLTAKRDAFYQSLGDFEQSFQSSQLTDTRYISREALHYLKTLGVEVTTVKGQVTSWLRHIWGMNGLLESGVREKDRSDHRHHAIDAAVVACVDQALYQSIVSIAKSLESQQSQLRVKDLAIDQGYPEFKDDVQSKLKKITIAHASQRKVAGALHEDTGIGFSNRNGAVYRKDLDTGFTSNNASKIIDPTVRQLVTQHIDNYGNKPRIAFAPDITVYHKDGVTPIKRVRVQQSKTNLTKMQANKIGLKDKQGNVFKWVTAGNIHHVAVFKKDGEESYKGVYVSAYVAYQRVVNKLPTVDRSALKGYTFQFELCKNDMVTAKQTKSGEKQTFRIRMIDKIDSRVRLELHTLAKGTEKGIFTGIEKLILVHEMQKVEVNAIGQLTYDQAYNRNQ